MDLGQLTSPQAALIGVCVTGTIAILSLWFARRDARQTGTRTATDIMQTCVKTMELINDELRTEIVEMKKRLAQLESEREGLLARIAELEATLATTCQERDQLRQRLAEMDAEITLLRTLLSEAQKRRLGRMLVEAKGD
jgi:septal ring factor EnvC (AmiA/AmiB activator)